MKARRVIVMTPEEATEIDLLLRDSLLWDPTANMKVLRVPTGDLYFLKETAPLIRSSREV